MGEVSTSMAGRVLLVLIALGSVSIHSMAQMGSSPESRFEQRRLRLMDVVSQERDRGFFTVAAKLATGRD